MTTITGLATKNLIISSEIGFKRGDEKSLTRNNNMPHNNNLNLLQIIIIKKGEKKLPLGIV